jgi:hypothetical protein
LKRIEIPVSVDVVLGFNRCDLLDEVVFAPGQEFWRSLYFRRVGCGYWTSREACRIVGFEWRGNVSLLRGGKFIRERCRALAMERYMAVVKRAWFEEEEEEEEENGEKDSDSFTLNQFRWNSVASTGRDWIRSGLTIKRKNIVRSICIFQRVPSKWKGSEREKGEL